MNTDNDNDIEFVFTELDSVLNDQEYQLLNRERNMHEVKATNDLSEQTESGAEAVKKEEAVQKPIEFKLEIEKKFLLKNLPILYLKKKKHLLINIEQYYFLVDGIWERYRVITDKKGVRYIKTIKRHVSPGVCEEGEVEITSEDFLKVKNTNNEKQLDYRLIQKTRFIVEFKGLKFEIDAYQGMRIITLEVELPSIDFIYSTPKEIKECILFELTGLKEFSNLNLATVHKEKKREQTEGEDKYYGD